VGTLGVLQRFERRLEGMVEGAFARAFKSELQPVEVASAVQREMDDRAAIVAQGRTLVPNDFVVELAESDHDRLNVYAESLGVELANLARDYAKEQGYSFVGPVRMRFEGVNDLTTGTFRIRSGVIRGSTVEGGEIRLPASDLPRTRGRGFPGNPRLIVSGPPAPGRPAGDGDQRTYELQTPVTLLGRGTDCDLRLVDPGVSRHHAELRVENDQVVLVDLGSTNGTFVNGQPVRRVALSDGTHVSLGRTTLVFRQDRQDGQGSGYAGTSY
jgi:pSer/pThr/pTyr-binding forkhead associated (FHA) protein